MSENSLPIEIVVSVDKASVGIAFSDLETKAASAGRKIGQGLGRGISSEGLEDGSKAFKKAMDSILKDGKAKADELYRINSIQQSRDIQTWQEGVKAFQAAEKAKASAAKQSADELYRINSIQQSRDIQTWQEGVKAFQAAEKAKATAAKQAADARATLESIQQSRDIQTWQEGVKAFQAAEKAKATAAKQAAEERANREALQQSRDIQTWQEGVKAFQAAEKAKASAAKQSAEERANREALQQSRDIQTWQEGVKAFQAAEKAKATAAKQAAEERARIQAIQEKRDYEEYISRNKPQVSTAQATFKTAGIRSPQDVAAELAALRETKKVWEELGPSTEGYKGALDQITRRTNILTEGNARARGSFHQMTAAVASLTFEFTGALYGFTAIAGAIAGGAIFGIKFLKDIEDAKMGISGTVLSMNLLAKESMTTGQAMAVANGVIGRLEQDSLKYNVSLADTAKLFQAIVGPGTAARMTMDEIGKTAVIGAVAVKSMGLNSMQVVQEVKDLVQGGIQSASSTLATALGLKDSDIKKAKESAQGLFAFLEERMAGFAMMSMERNNTLSGAWDMLWMKVQRLFADPKVFSAVVDSIKQISNAIATIETDSNGNFVGLKFNEDLVKSVNSYMEAMKVTVTVIGTAIEYGIKLGSIIGQLIVPIGAVYAAMKLWPILIQSTFAMFITDVAALTTTLGASVGAMYAVETAMLRLKAIALSIGTGGLIGAFIVGVTLIDWKNIFDQIFVSFSDRILGAKAQIRSLSTLALQEERKNLIQDIANISTKKDASGRFTGEAKGVFEMSNADIMERDSKRARLIAVEQRLSEKLESDKRQADLDRAQELRVSTIQQGFKAEQSLADQYIKNDPLAKRNEAVKKANEELSAALSGLGEQLQQADPISLEEYKKRELEIVKHYNSAIEAANKPIDKANARDAAKAAREAAKEQREILKQALDDYKAIEGELNRAVAEGSMSFIEAYNARMVAIDKYLVVTNNASKFSLEKSKTETELLKYVDDLYKKSIDIKVKYYGDTTSAGDAYIAEFEANSSKERAILEKTIEGLENLERALSPSETAALDKAKKAMLNMDAATEAVKKIKPLIDAIEKLKQIEAKYAREEDSINLKVLESGGGAMASYNSQIELLDSRNRKLQEAQAIYDQNAIAIANVNDLQGEERKRVEEIIEALNKAKKSYLETANAMDKTFGKGAKQAFEEYQIAAADTASQAHNLFSNMFKNLEDAFTNFIMTGKMDFKSFVNSMIADLARMAAKQIVLSFVGVGSSVAGGVGGMLGGGGIGGSLLSNAGGLFGGASSLNGLGASVGNFFGIGPASSQYGMLAAQNAGFGSAALFEGLGAGAEQAALLAEQTAAFGAAGEMATAEALGATTALEGFGSVLAAIPGWGWALAGAGLLLGSSGILDHKGGPKVGSSSYQSGAGTVIPGEYQGETFNRTSSGGDPFKIKDVTSASIKQISSLAGKFGKTLGDNFAFGLAAEFDPQGTAPGSVGYMLGNQKVVSKQVNGQDIEAGAKELMVMAQRGMIASLAELDLSPIVNPLLDSIPDISQLTEEQASKILKLVDDLSSMTSQAVDNLFGESFDIEKFKPFAKEGELTIETFARLAPVFSATNTVAEMLGKDTKTAFGAVGLASTDMRQKLIDSAGGIEKFTSQAAFFYENFYSATERAARDLNKTDVEISDAFEEMGIAVPKSSEEFRTLVEGLDLSTEAGQKMYNQLMDVAPAFDKVAKASKAAIASIASSLDTLHGTNANTKVLARIEANTAMAAVTEAMPWITSFDQLSTITVEDASKYSAANQILIANALAAGAAVKGFGDDVNQVHVNQAIVDLAESRKARSYTNTPGGVGWQTVDEYAASVINPLLTRIDDAFGKRDPTDAATKQLAALQAIIDDAKRKLPSAIEAEKTGISYGPESVASLTAIIEAAQKSIDNINLAASYGGKGLELKALDDWYAEQKAYFTRYGLDLVALEEEYNLRRKELLEGAVGGISEKTKTIIEEMKRLQNQMDAITSLSNSVTDAINSIKAEQGDYSATIEESNRRLVVARQRLTDANGLDDQIKAAGELKNAIMARYAAESAEIKRIQNLIANMKNFVTGINDSIESIKSTQSGYNGVAYNQEKVDAAKALLAGATTPEEQLTAAGKLHTAIMGRYDAEMAALQKRREEENKAGQEAVDAANKAGQEAVDAANALNAAFRSIGEYAKSLLIGEESALNEIAKLKETEAQYAQLLAQSKNGDKDAISKLAGITSEMLSQQKNLSGSALEYARQFAPVQGAMEELGKRAGIDQEFKPQVYAEDTAKWESETLEIQNRTIDELTALNSLTESWIENLESTLPNLETLQQETLDELEHLNELTADWQESVQDAMIEQTSQFVALNLTATQIADALVGLDGRIAALINNALQASISAMQPVTIGTGELKPIPEFLVSNNESIPPAIYSSDASSSSDFSEVVTEVRALRTETSQLRTETASANRAIAQYTLDSAKVLRKWDGDGQPEVRVI